MQTVIVTGGAQGIGRVTTQYLLTHGYQVAIWENDTEALKDFSETLQGTNAQAQVIPCDITSEIAIKDAVRETLDRFGQINHLVNNAAVMVEKPLDRFSLDDWNTVISTNLTGPFLCAKYTAPHLAEQHGSIVNLCSTRAFQSEPDTFAYSASKGGIFALTHSLAISLGPDVRVNCISPGWIDVSALKKKGKAHKEALRPEDHAQHPVGRVGQADDIARMVLFLIYDANSFITGQNFTIDGGMTRKMIYVP
ncbi:SDR family oxidoreductase [Larkinella insperata]|uniref:SDR family oxidoreductase n=1 Tax=Larkinella insperata TaxID=332158 RepID=A0ABW3Q8Z5_9BACT|nr:SDR family oxidoreductase [Larkinella insperata]